MPTTSFAITRAFFLYSFCVGVVSPEGEQSPPPSLVEWCQIAHQMPKLFDTVFQGLNERLSVLAIHRAVDGVEEAKKKSVMTPPSEGNSEPPATSGESIPTSSEGNPGENQ